tara:strand:+ start:5081 stop:5254 length:174 start_codon:yes stop_codon:yes gene_type:complete
MFHEQSLIDALNLLIEKIESMDDRDKKILEYCEEIYNKNKSQSYDTFRNEYASETTI